MEQNYFQYNDSFYKPHKGVAMGSPLSGTLAELYLQRIENEYIKQWLDSKEIHYYKRYVDDILILFNTKNTRGTNTKGHQPHKQTPNFQDNQGGQ